MRILADQDVYAVTLRELTAAGHDVVRSSDRIDARAPDAAVLAEAIRDGRVLLTRDLDFGRLMHALPTPPSAVLILRFRRHALSAVHAELMRVVAAHTAADLRGAVVIIEADRHRIRRLIPRAPGTD